MVNMTKLVRSKWLDIAQVFLLRVYGPRRSHCPYTREKRTWPISSHFDPTSLVNKGFITRKRNTIFLQDAAGNPE